MKKIDEIETFVNRNGFPILRKCQNCIFWNSQTDYPTNLKLGFCTIKPYFFAYTLAPNLYPLTKEFFLCEEHRFVNEKKLEEVSEKVLLKDCIKNKEDIIEKNIEKNYNK